MKSFKNNKNFIYAILCGVALGGILGFLNVEIELSEWVIIWFSAFIVILIFIYIKAISNIKLVCKGNYSKAIQIFERVIEKQGRNEKIINAAMYNISICHYRRGAFHEAEAYLDKINLGNCDDNIKWGYFNLRASNSILLEENINVAEEYLEKSAQLFNPVEVYPLRAYFEGIKGNQEEALRYIEAYVNKKKKRKLSFGFTKAILVFDQFVYDIQNNYFIGMAYLKLDKPQLAKEYLQKTSMAQYENYFSESAGDILKKLEGERE